MNLSSFKVMVIKTSTLRYLILGTVIMANALFASSLLSNAYASNEHKNAVDEHLKTELNVHADWQTLLSLHIKTINNGHSTEVDYAGFKQQRPRLKSYLKQLSDVSRSEFDAWPNAKQLAFLINAYNAWTVEFILTEYPDISSIKDLGSFFNSPWDKSFIPLLDKKISLNDIEHGLIRGSDRYNDPRIHFAVNCASIGCPALREEAYTADRLDQQLTEQTQRFLTDKSRNVIKGDDLYLSSIFKWYGDDFETGFRGTQSIQAFILLYAEAMQLTASQKSALMKQAFDLNYLDYDWKLNDVK